MYETNSSMGYSWDTDNNRDYCSTYVATSTLVHSGTYTTPVAYSNFVALQWPISVMWLEADLSRFDPPSAPILAPTSSTSSQSSSTTSTPSSTQGTAGGAALTSSTSIPAASTTSMPPATSSAAPSGGLSTGAQAGIGVGVAVPVVAFLGLGIWFYLYRKRAKGSKAENSDSPVDGTGRQPFGMKAELAGDEAHSPRGYRAEKGGLLHGQDGDIAELEPQRDGLNELEEQNKRMEPVELPGNAIGENAAAEVAAVQSPIGRNAGHTEGQTAARKSSRDPLVDDRL